MIKLKFWGYRCKSGNAIFARRVTWNYAYSPFNTLDINKNVDKQNETLLDIMIRLKKFLIKKIIFLKIFRKFVCLVKKRTKSLMNDQDLQTILNLSFFSIVLKSDSYLFLWTIQVIRPSFVFFLNGTIVQEKFRLFSKTMHISSWDRLTRYTVRFVPSKLF